MKKKNFYIICLLLLLCVGGIIAMKLINKDYISADAPVSEEKPTVTQHVYDLESIFSPQESSPQVSDPTDGTFDLDDYTYYLECFFPDEDLILGPIGNAEIAKKKAEKVWVEIYGEKVKNEEPYNVAFDEENQVWLVFGSLPKRDGNGYATGGTAHILIQKSDGKVLAVWHTK